jgi:hypothetical protein
MQRLVAAFLRPLRLRGLSQRLDRKNEGGPKHGVAILISDFYREFAAGWSAEHIFRHLGKGGGGLIACGFEAVEFDAFVILNDEVAI